MQYCQRILERLDAHLDRELAPELAAEVDQHLEHCEECALALETRRRVKEGLRRAVTLQEGMPADLEERLRQSREGSAPWRHWPLAIAAGLLLALGGWALVRQARLNSAQELSALKIGVDDHIHCALNRRYPEGIQELGADFADLVPLVKSQVSGDFTIKAAHHCTLRGHTFVHLILTEPGTTLSVLLRRRRASGLGRAKRCTRRASRTSRSPVLRVGNTSPTWSPISTPQGIQRLRQSYCPASASS